MRKHLALISICGALAACDTNFTQFMATTDQNGSIEQRLVEARYDYDKGNFDDAISCDH